ncbi:MAG: ABC transporter ATP-binding protein [Lachnospiraceae bacterium]
MLSINQVTIQYFDRKIPDTVLHDISFHVKEGEILGIVGESGSGKSTLAKAIMGLLNRKDMEKTGEIIVQGIDVLHCKREELRTLQGKAMGMIFQEPMTALNPLKKVGWQIEESLKIHTTLDKKQRKEIAYQMIENVELKDVERIYHSYPSQLSGGQRQRVCIAAALITNPQLLIADEATTALDVTVQAQIIELLKKVNREKKISILFISHDLSLVKKLCHRVIVMKDGEIVEEGITKEIFENPSSTYTKELIDAIPRYFRGIKE